VFSIELIQINVALHLINTVLFIKIYFHCRFIQIVYHVYIVELYVLLDDICYVQVFINNISVQFCFK